MAEIMEAQIPLKLAQSDHFLEAFLEVEDSRTLLSGAGKYKL